MSPITIDLSNLNRQAALAYVASGFHVLALEPKGKRPLRGLSWEDASDDPEQVTEWWDESPDANVGIACIGDLAVLDVDGAGGYAQLAELEAQHGALAPGYRVITGDGEHCYLRRNGQQLQGWRYGGLELKCAGYVVAPPSVHPSGRWYTAPDPELPWPEVPAWLAVSPKPAAPERQAPVGAQDANRLRLAAQAAVDGELDKVRAHGSQPDTGRDTRLFACCRALWSHVAAMGLSEADARVVAEQARQLLGLPDDPQTRHQVEHGRKLGLAEPYVLTDRPTTPGPGRIGQWTVGVAAPTTLKPGDYALDMPNTVPATWGRGSEVLMTPGEPTMVTGPIAVGKTTVVQQLALRYSGVRQGDLLNLPVAPAPDGAGPLLYIAADRPSQALRSLRRMISEDDRQALRRRWRWQLGWPMAVNIVRDPDSLLWWLEALPERPCAVVIDSLKDAAPNLADSETGAAINVALQRVVAAEIEVLVSHHQRKAQGGGESKPKTLADVYGSVFITAGMGSVILLWGEPGSLAVELSTLKAPADQVGPLEVILDPDRGEPSAPPPMSLAEQMTAAGKPTFTVREACEECYASYSSSLRERARRKADREVAAGLLEVASGGQAGGAPTTYKAIHASHSRGDSRPPSKEGGVSSHRDQTALLIDNTSQSAIYGPADGPEETR
jgi:replicative DNA helicase